MTGRLPVLTAAGDTDWEARLVGAWERADLGVTVVRRCVDLADLLATAATGVARVAVVAADLRRFDREAVARLASWGVAVVAVTPSDDGPDEQRWRRLGVVELVGTAAAPQEVAEAAIRAGGSARVPAPPPTPPDTPSPDWEPAPRPGRLVAVWGPTGAPGRTTVAVGVAAELAAAGAAAVLVDADVYGGSVAQVLGLLEDAPGLAAAVRAANLGTLDAALLVGLLRAVPIGGAAPLRVLTGIVRPDRWPEFRPSSIEVVLDLLRVLAPVTIVDCGFCLEQDEELSYDTAAPRRNGATLAVLAAADQVLAVGSADPVGLARLVRGLGTVREVREGARPDGPDGGSLGVVFNRVRPGLAPGEPAREYTAALVRHAGVAPLALLPYDQPAADAALGSGRTLVEAAPASQLRRALAGLARQAGQLPAGGLARHPGRRLPRLAVGARR
ncbi:MAG: AAA family ATPase [Mycobacteriales bacterium]